MPWFYVEDDFSFHRKTIAAGNAAVGLWTRAGSWSMQTLTDGEIPAEMARSLGTTKETKRLVDVGFWVPKGDGYAFHQWETRQRSRVQVEADREAARQRQRRYRNRGQERRGNDETDDGVTE